MTQEALRMAHKALIGLSIKHGEMTDEGMDAIAAIKEALALQALHDENERLGLYKDAYAQPEQEPVAFFDWYDNAIWGNEDFKQGCHRSWNAAIKYTTPPQRTEQNFCPRCGKRTKDLTHIHTCTPPQD